MPISHTWQKLTLFGETTDQGDLGRFDQEESSRPADMTFGLNERARVFADVMTRVLRRLGPLPCMSQSNCSAPWHVLDECHPCCQGPKGLWSITGKFFLPLHVLFSFLLAFFCRPQPGSHAWRPPTPATPLAHSLMASKFPGLDRLSLLCCILMLAELY